VKSVTAQTAGLITANKLDKGGGDLIYPCVSRGCSAVPPSTFWNPWSWLWPRHALLRGMHLSDSSAPAGAGTLGRISGGSRSRIASALRRCPSGCLRQAISLRSVRSTTG